MKEQIDPDWKGKNLEEECMLARVPVQSYSDNVADDEGKSDLVAVI